MTVSGACLSMDRPEKPYQFSPPPGVGGVMSVQVPVESWYRHTPPVPPSYGPPLSLVAMYSAPPATSPWWANAPLGCPATRSHVDPPLVERYTVFCRSATPT